MHNFLKNNELKNFFRKFLFIIISSQIIYLLIHLQFLFGIPQASLSITDSVFIFICGIISFCLANNSFKRYLISMFLILLPTIEIQYLYITFFEKIFHISELSKFTTLLIVSPWYQKVLFSVIFAGWSICSSYMIASFLLYKQKYKTFIFKILLIFLSLLYMYITFTTTRIIAPWIGSYKQAFFMKGVIYALQSQQYNPIEIITKNTVEESVSLLKKIEKNRSQFSIQNSPEKAPVKLRPIVMIVFESFYDYKDFSPVFGTNDPFPKEYRELMNSNTYTGPNQTFGSFDARVALLTGSYPLTPSRENQKKYTLPYELKKYGYKTITLESITPTYHLETHYKNWFIDEQNYCVYGNRMNGKGINPNQFQNEVIKIIQNTPDDIVPFYFGFTFLGHFGSLAFTKYLSDPENIDQYLNYFDTRKNKKMAKELLKAAIFNAERIIFLKNKILEKYPNALIIFKSDHISSELNYNITTSKLPIEIKDKFKTDPANIPLIMIDGTNGLVKLPRGIAPANIPLIILAKAGLPYKNTILSLLYRETTADTMNIYGQLYNTNNNRLSDSHPMYKKLEEQNRAIQNISIDLYNGNQYADLSISQHCIEK